jgi:hypothetical protein
VTATPKATPRREPRTPRARAIGFVGSGIVVCLIVVCLIADDVGDDIVVYVSWGLLLVAVVALVGVVALVAFVGVAALFGVVGVVLAVLNFVVALYEMRTQEAVSAAAVSSSIPNRVAGWSVRLLPAQERERYRDEFLGDLYDLRDKPWRSQMGYALRLLACSVRLRQELRQPAPEPARQQDGKHDGRPS